MLDYIKMISVIIPTFNEMNSNYLEKILLRLHELKSEDQNLEIICIDSNSTDGTKDLINTYADRVEFTETKSRGMRLNKGVEIAKNEIILFHHPRSILATGAITELIQVSAKVSNPWGAFTHAFDHNYLLLKFTSFYSNYIRGPLQGIYYLDHCIFAHKKLLKQAGPIKNVDIFEDTELSLSLKKFSAPIRLNSLSTTSAIRFIKNGFFRQAFKNQVLKWKFYFNKNHKEINKNYEKNLNLNADYNPKRENK